jgi:hypothetical protein
MFWRKKKPPEPDRDTVVPVTPNGEQDGGAPKPATDPPKAPFTGPPPARR